MERSSEHFFATERVSKIIWSLAPPIMFAQLVHGLYNVVDSYFVGQYSNDGLAALSLLFPIQLFINALGHGAGIGVNTLVARFNGAGEPDRAKVIARVGTLLAALNWLIFAMVAFTLLEPYLAISTTSEAIRSEARAYGYIICTGSLVVFLDSMWMKVHQAEGNMRRPMMAQITGAVVNMILDPILIGGLFGLPQLGITGAAIATVIGQFCAMMVVLKGGYRGLARPCEVKANIRLIYKTALPAIVMQSLYTVYIFGLNQILVRFSDAAVTALGLYYKLQPFFFVPLFGLQGCVLPVLSFNYAAGDWQRCREIFRFSLGMVGVFMAVGMVIFELIPGPLIAMFGANQEVLDIGIPAFRIIAIGFVPAAVAMLMPTIFQAVNRGKTSLVVIILRQIVLLVPIAWLLSRYGLIYTWLTFPISECITVVVALLLYRNTIPKTEEEMNYGIENRSAVH